MEKNILNFTVLIEKDEKGWYIASVPDIPGCYTQGRTIEQVIERIKEAVEVCLESDDDIKPLDFVGVRNIEIKI